MSLKEPLELTGGLFFCVQAAIAAPRKTVLEFTADSKFARHDALSAYGTWTSDEGHLEWRVEGEPLVTHKVEKSGESQLMFSVPLLEEVSWRERQERSEDSEFRVVNNIESPPSIHLNA